jgi:hypothetical protein
MPLPDPTAQKAGRDALEAILKTPKEVWAIHYACQSIAQAGEAPRVGTIAMANLGTRETRVFAVSQIIEEHQLEADDVAINSDEIERTLLKTFFKELASQRDHQYVHWNMGTLTYGFAALETRYRALGGEPFRVSARDRHDLADLLIQIYGDDIVKAKSKLVPLMKLNQLAPQSVLSGAEEAAAMSDGHYRDVTSSVEAKVRAIAKLAWKAHDKTLKTEANVIARRGIGLRLTARDVVQNPMVWVVSTVIGLLFAMLRYGTKLTGG